MSQDEWLDQKMNSFKKNAEKDKNNKMQDDWLNKKMEGFKSEINRKQDK